MSLFEDISKAISFIEKNIYEDISIDDISNSVHISSFYFQKAFAIVCGYTVGEYIRNRRLSLAGRDLKLANMKVIDVAFKYFYESPDSFTKAFTRFHGLTPIQAKNKECMLKYFEPLHMRIEVSGGFDMNYKIIKKNEFKVVGYATEIEYEKGYEKCPKFWADHLNSGRCKIISGMYAICDDTISNNKFKYIIADEYDSTKKYPSDVIEYIVPAKLWAVFTCVGKLPNALQEVNTKIFKEWLPNNPEYEFDGGINIEYYTDPSLYKNEDDYVSEIWVPVKTK